MPLGPSPEADWRTASLAIRPYGDILFIEMDPYAEKVGVIVLPSEVGGHLRPDAGTVVACGADIEEVQPGSRVLVLPYGGNIFGTGSFSDYKSKGEIRIYGNASKNEFEHVSEDWNLSVIAKVDEICPQALGQWVFIKRDPLQETEKGIVLSHRDRFRSQQATVVNAGGRTILKAGMRVVYHGEALMVDTEFLAVRYPEFVGEGDPKDYAFIKECDLYAVIQ